MTFRSRPSTSAPGPGRRALGWLLVLALLATGTLSAQTTVYGRDGERYRVVSGLYRDLFPNGNHGVRRAHPVLALEVQRDGVAERWLVPGSEGPELDSSPTLVLEPGTGAVHALWTREGDGEAYELFLARFDGDGWHDPIEVSGNAGAAKSALQVVLTRDFWGEESRRRTVAHLLWAEAGAGVHYTPIVLVDGEYLGWNPVVRLDDLDPGPPIDGAWDHPLVSVPVIDDGDDGTSLVVALASRASGRLLTVRLRVLPWSLLDLADDARSHITVVGLRSTEGTVLGLAEQARSHITVVGHRFHEGVTDYIAEKVYLEVLSSGPRYTSDDLREIGDRVWRAVMASGASILGNAESSSVLPCSQLDLGKNAESSFDPLHQLELCVLSSRELPDIGDDPLPFLSKNGERVVLTWLDAEGALRYRLDAGPGWSEERVAPIDQEVDLETARASLRTLVRPD